MKTFDYGEYEMIEALDTNEPICFADEHGYYVLLTDAQGIIDALTAERDALRKQLDQGYAVGWQIWMGGFGWCNCGKDQYECAAEAERRQVYAAPHAKPVSNDEYKAIIEVGYKLGYEAALCDITKPAIQAAKGGK